MYALLLWLGCLMAVYSRDTFTGADDTDVDGRTADGGGSPALANGTHTRHPAAGAPNDRIDILSGRAVMTRGDAGYVDYINADLSGLTDAQTRRVTGRFEESSAGFNFLAAAVRMHETEETGYKVEFDDLGFLRLYDMDDGDYTILRELELPAPDIGVDQTVQLCIDLADVLRVYLQGVLKTTFDLHTDSAFDTGVPRVVIFTGGVPAWGMGNDDTPTHLVSMSQVEVDGACLEEPCEGDDDNPYPWDPPPVPPQPAGAYLRQNLGWLGPLPVERLRPQARLVSRGGLPGTAIRANLAWRSIVEVHETDPPPDTDFPPHYDPCELLPPLPIPPTEPVGDPPDRLFFAYAHPIPQLGPLFTAAVNATGGWSPGNLAQAAARSSYIIGAQGNYAKFQASGPSGIEYHPALMDIWVDSHASYMPGLIASPFFYGQQFFDDWEVQRLWNWPGWTTTEIIAEMGRVMGRAKTLYSGIRTGFRARARQFSGSNYPANVDFIISQFHYRLGMSAAEYVDEELTLAAARGWDVLFSINTPHGGPGTGRSPMTPSEALAAWTEMLVDVPHMHGVGMWQYQSSVLTPEWLDVYAMTRNGLAALGPP